VQQACRLVEQGFPQGSCSTFYKPSKGLFKGHAEGRACDVTMQWEDGVPSRKIKSFLLSRPEDYLSLYQSGCNMSCLKCHSWEFSQYRAGEWMSPEGAVRLAEEYARLVTVWEPRERATSSHAQSLCKHCGQCVTRGKRSVYCPEILTPGQVILSPQGYGPARNIVAFTGGDLACRPEWYSRVAELIKEKGLDLWVLLETNGYGLTPQNLDDLQRAGIDSFWLDIKAWDNEVHRKLTGVENQRILRLPEELLHRWFTLEVLSLFIPGWVEEDQIGQIAALLAAADPGIYFTILAFFGQYKLDGVPGPNLEQMLRAYRASKEAGLQNVRLGNLGVFIKSDRDYQILLQQAGDAV